MGIRPTNKLGLPVDVYVIEPREKIVMKRAAILLSVALLAAVLAAGELPARAQTSPLDAPPAGEWLAGDLHVHTTYSHDSYGGPRDDNTDPFEDVHGIIENPPQSPEELQALVEDFPGSFEDLITAGHPVTSQFAVAATRGLDYLAITDHNDVRSQADPGWQSATDLGVIPVPGYENSLDGHAQMLGATKIYDSGDQSADAVNTMADALRAKDGDNGVFQINHPNDGDGRFPDNFGWTYGFGVFPDTIEVWNITRVWQKPMPSSNSHDDATRYWEQWLDKGYHVGATGGSDTHWLTTTAAQGVGQPTTWVYTAENSAEGILEGLRQGRTFISHQPPNYGGAQIFLEADANGDGSYESMVGDTVPVEAPLRARVEGAPGSMLRVVTNGGVEAFAPVQVTSPSFIHGFSLKSGTWARAETFEPDAREQRRGLCDEPFGDKTTYCRNQVGVLAMTSALYLAPETQPSETPTPTPTADPEPQGTKLEFTSNSAQSGQYSDEARFEARLTTADGTPLPDREIAFELVGSEETTSFTATTDAGGVAQKLIDLAQKPGQYQLFARYAGENEAYAPTANTMSFLIDKEDTDLTLVTDGKGSKRTLSATLADRDSSEGIAGRTIEFTADNSSICTVATNGDGIAKCSVPARFAGGHHTYEAMFSGDDYYIGSSASAR